MGTELVSKTALDAAAIYDLRNNYKLPEIAENGSIRLPYSLIARPNHKNTAAAAGRA